MVYNNNEIKRKVNINFSQKMKIISNVTNLNNISKNILTKTSYPLNGIQPQLLNAYLIQNFNQYFEY